MCQRIALRPEKVGVLPALLCVLGGWGVGAGVGRRGSDRPGSGTRRRPAALSIRKDSIREEEADTGRGELRRLARRSGRARAAARIAGTTITGPPPACSDPHPHRADPRPHRVVQRIEKVLEDAGINLSVVATGIMGVSGRSMLEALSDEHRDPEPLAESAKGRMRVKIPALIEATIGQFTDHHGFLIGMHVEPIDRYGLALAELDARIDAEIEPLRAARELLCSIPGYSTTLAEIFLAATGGAMSVFPTAGHLASWAGTAPGVHESAGRVNRPRPDPASDTSRVRWAPPP